VFADALPGSTTANNLVPVSVALQQLQMYRNIPEVMSTADLSEHNAVACCSVSALNKGNARQGIVEKLSMLDLCRRL
jgi:hypothetical protein